MLFVRPTMQSDVARLDNLEGSVLLYSLWDGYREQDGTQQFLDGLQKRGVTVHALHTSGHATLPALQRMVDMLQPRNLVPIHTEHPGEFERFGVPVRRMRDGEAIAL